MRRALILLALLAAAAPASAAPPRPRVDLPAAVTASRTGSWLVGARPGRRADAIARRHGARVLETGAYAVPRGRARELASALGPLLVNAEPDRISRLRQARAIADDPLDAQSRWRDAIVDPGLAPPAVAPDSPLLAMID
jgi:hypothetical protein